MTTTPEKPPASQKPQQATSDGSFESVHNRDKEGQFTSGADANRGGQRVDQRAAENLLRDNGYWREGMTYQEALARAKANLGTVTDGDTLKALMVEAGQIHVPTKEERSRKKKKEAKKRSAAATRPGVAADRGKRPKAAATMLTPSAGRWDKPWPKGWGAEPPKEAPGGLHRDLGYQDGSALYEGGLVYDPKMRAFRQAGTGLKTAPRDLEVKGEKRMELMEHKALPIADFKVVDPDEGVVECIVSVTGIEDNVGDVILPGAYEKTLQVRTPKGIFCADEDTEILTSRGWLRYDEVTTSDEAYTLDTANLTTQFEPISAVNVFPPEPRQMRHVEVGGFSSLTTMGHRWPVRARDGHARWTTTAALTQGQGIFRALARSDAPTEAKWSDAFVEVVAWFWNEGNYDHCRCSPTCSTLRLSISQSLAVNPIHCATIRRALDSVFPKGWHEYPLKDGRQTSFRLLKNPSETIAAVCAREHDKAPTAEFLLSLTHAQLRLLIATCIDGDGHDEIGGATRWAQRSQHSIRMFEMACALAGVPTNTRPQKPSRANLGRPTSTVTLLQRKVAKPFDALWMADRSNQPPRTNAADEIVTYDGQVWCPTTPSGTWLARRNGSVYFTGNSHDWDKPIAKTLSIRELRPGHPDLPTMMAGKAWPAEAGALKVKCQFNLKTERGRDAYEDVKFYEDDQCWSVGYNVPTGGSKTTNGVRYIKTMDLFEFSPVLFGAMPLAGTLSVKSAQQAWAAVKDIVGGQHGPTFAQPEGLGGRQAGNIVDRPTSGPFNVCPEHGDQPGEVRAKCMATRACALKTAGDANPQSEEKGLITAAELSQLRELRAGLQLVDGKARVVVTRPLALP